MGCLSGPKIVSAILHYVIKFYIRPGCVSFISKIIFGWIGTRLGSPVFVHRFGGLVYEDVYIIPAIPGSAALFLIMVDCVLTVKGTIAKKFR